MERPPVAQWQSTRTITGRRRFDFFWADCGRGRRVEPRRGERLTSEFKSRRPPQIPHGARASISAVDSEDSRSNRDAGTGSAPGCSDALQATRAEFDPPALHRPGPRSGIRLDSKSGQRGSTPRQPATGRVAKWEGAGLQLRHRDGSIPSSASARTVVRAVRTRSSKPERRVRLSHGAQDRRSRRSFSSSVAQW